MRAQIPYLRELGVRHLHLMPLLAPRAGDSDGGYAVADFPTVRPDLGSMADLRELAGALRSAGICLVLDLVLNHVAREHAWAVAARAGSRRHRAYFHVFDDQALPDAYERSLPEVFPDFASGNFTWDPELSAWVWTTFHSWQWDLDWSNPDVLCEYADDIGWAIDDGDAAAVGLSGPAHRAFLSDFYAGEFPGSPARGLVFQDNPATGDRRISGSAAALAGLDAALESGDPVGVDFAIARLLLGHAVVLGWGGVPVLWM